MNRKRASLEVEREVGKGRLKAGLIIVAFVIAIGAVWQIGSNIGPRPLFADAPASTTAER